ncbi:hypothetical protein D3C76_1492870 [compost metagenome]
MGERGRKRFRLAQVLAQKGVQGATRLHRQVGQGIGAGLVFAQAQHQFDLLIGRQQSTQIDARPQVLRLGHVGQGSRQAGQHIDCRVVAALRELA